MTRYAGAFSLVVVALVMALAVVAVPYPGSLVFVAAIVGGAAFAFLKARKAGVKSGD